ncbi:hypothetical protein BK816_00280 [Boudabousia tangfeifanii]|uniref:MATE family efflux transporter n=1 Tax=Boudabousia tangfeifanii TaxID=1912795 RepID=A0A1D9MIA3_9ACTO|nr:MATE family efflux transporter [Boudabousia tangfeifanii]AOZ71919.1 hypothetical protein BK816_00280 [Boudabousia tangfeifanii]
MTDPAPAKSARDVDRQILQLTAPAFAAMLAEPLMVMADSAMVGHLGTDQLAGLALGSTVVMTAVYLFIFLTYTTTALASRKLGEGQPKEAISAGIGGLWLAGALGLIIMPILWFGSPLFTSWFDPNQAVAQYAVQYIHASTPGVLGMFLVLAGTGAMRGLLDTRTPMIVAISGTAFNAVANAVLIYGLGWGIIGSGAGTSLSQTLMALALLSIIGHRAKARGVSLAPSAKILKLVGQAGAPLVARTVSLRIAIILTTWAAAQAGAITLSSYQAVTSIYTIGTYALDSLAVASQALIGHGLGTGSDERVRLVLRRCATWAWRMGGIILVIFFAGSYFFPWIFTTDPQVRLATTVGLLAIGACMPLAGYVFLLDGVLIGANRARFLAIASIVNLLVYAPIIWLVGHFGSALSPAWASFWLWLAIGGAFMGIRGLTNTYGAKDLLRK